MEETNPWLDRDCMEHKNKKSIKPKPEIRTESVLTKGLKTSDDKGPEDFLLKLINGSLVSQLPRKTQNWISQNLGADWEKEFLRNLEMLKDDLTHSRFYPSTKEMIFLKYIFLLQLAN